MSSKRVTGNYYIPDFSKGLIDGSSISRIDDNYKRKATELTNFWIKNNNSVAKRPPVRPVTGFEGLKHIIDVVETEDRIVFLRSVDLNIPTEDEEGNPIQQIILQRRRRTLLEELGWRPGVATEVGEPGVEHTDFISPDDPVDFQLWHYGTTLNNVARDDLPPGVVFDGERDIYPTVTVLDSYDKVTREQLLDERFYFVRWNFTNNTRTRNWVFPQGTSKNFTSEVNRAYGDLDDLNLTPLTAPADTTTPAYATWSEQADTIKEYTELLEQAPVHTFVINKGEVVDFTTVHGVPHHPLYPVYIREVPLESVSKTALSQLRLYDPVEGDFVSSERLIPRENLFQNTDLPTRLFTNHFGKVELYAFGLDYIWDKERIRPAIRSSEEFNESVMGTFVTKPTSVDPQDLEVLAGIYPMTATVGNSDPAALGTTRFLNDRRGADRTLDDLIDEIPDLYHIYDYLRFSLCNFSNVSTTHSTYGTLSYIVPDLQIPVTDTDIPAYGQFLFKANYLGETYNVFACHFDYNTFYESENNPTPAWRQPSTDEQRTRFPNGYGDSFGDFGIYLAFQKGNGVNDDDSLSPGQPTFNPALTQYKEGTEHAATDFIVYLALDLTGERVQEAMDNLKLISFYSSDGASRFNSNGMVQLSKYTRNRGDTAATDPARRCPVGNYLKYSSTGLHLIPWANADLYNIFWEYASSGEPRGRSIAPRHQIPSDGDVSSVTSDAVMSFSDSILSEAATLRRLLAQRNNDIPRGFAAFNTSSRTPQIELARAVITALSTGSTEHTQLYQTLIFQRTGSAGSYGVSQFINSADIRALTLPAGAETTAFVAGTLSFREYMDHLISSGFSQADIGLPSTPTNYRFEAVAPDGSDLIYYYAVDEVDVTAESTTDTTVDVEIQVTRDNIDGIRESYQQRFNTLTAAAVATTHFYPESIFFANYFENTAAIPFSAGDRVARAVGNVVAFSNVQNILSEFEPARFSTGYLTYIGNAASPGQNIAVGAQPDYLRNSNLGFGISSHDRTLTAAEPQNLTLFNKDLTPVEIQDYIETSRGGLLLTSRRVYSISGFTSAITGRVIHESGFTGQALTDDSFVIGAEGDRIKALRYYEEAGGYVTDIVNAELDLPGEILGGVSLINKHKVLVFYCANDPNGLYTISTDNRRGIKGFTRFTIPCSVGRLTKIDEDRVGIVTGECAYLEMDFSKNFDNEEGKWQDSIAVDQQNNPLYQTYECAITTLPILQLYAQDFSLLKTTTLRYLVVGCSGHPAFDISVIDGNTGDVAAETSFRRIRPGMVTVDAGFSGQVVVKSIPRNGSAQPKLRLSKTDDEFIEFSSVNIQLGG